MGKRMAANLAKFLAQSGQVSSVLPFLPIPMRIYEHVHPRRMSWDVYKTVRSDSMTGVIPRHRTEGVNRDQSVRLDCFTFQTLTISLSHHVVIILPRCRYPAISD